MGWQTITLEFAQMESMTRTLTISEEAYERLEVHNREGESFSETILRLTGAERDLMKGLGSMSEVDGFRDAVESTRDDLDEDLGKRANR